MTKLYEWIDFDIKGDVKGKLVAIESQKSVPFQIARVYYIFDTKDGVRRGLHAHRILTQIAICISGACSFLMDNGIQKKTIRMDSRNKGLIIYPMVWHEMFDFTADCVLLVLADGPYDEDEYIRNYPDFMRLLENPSE